MPRHTIRVDRPLCLDILYLYSNSLVAPQRLRGAGAESGALSNNCEPCQRGIALPWQYVPHG